MNDWQKDWWQQIEKTTGDIEKFFHDVDKGIESVSKEIVETLEELGEQFQDNLTTDIDLFVEDLLNFLRDVDFESEYNIWEDIDNFTSDTDFVDITTEIPTPNNYAACMGCSNYHGRRYNGQILVCGMHPYGYEDGDCPDWEGSNI